ncbi:MAG TPA: DUF5752 family protein [Nitrospiria bacterium]|nr:DUF5752 family protein [Nitrospiria bacterium]
MGKTDSRAKRPFRFFECTSLIQPTGRQAQDLSDLLSLIRIVDPGVIYHHTHQYFLKAAVETPEYPNDFAVWAARSLEESALAEKLANLDLYAFSEIEQVRAALIEIIESYLGENPAPRPARDGDAFFFNDAVTIIAETGFEAETLPAFLEALDRVGTSSIYFHFFEARFRLRRPADDFSVWIGSELNRPDLAQAIRGLDPYQLSLEGLRHRILTLLRPTVARGVR